VQIARRVLDPPPDARPDLWIVQQMAARMGLSWRYEGPDDGVAGVFDEMRHAMPSLAGITWDRLQREGAVTYPCRAEGDPGEPVVFRDRFPTPDGRATLVPVSASAAAEVPDAEFPLVLITGRELEHWHTGAMTRRSVVLDAIEPGPVAMLHPATMSTIGVEPGQPMRVESRRGSIVLACRADPSVPESAVFIPFAFAEAAANLLTNAALDPFGKIPEFKYCAVRAAAARDHG
jgi:formate dehydrogenase major subunit